MLVFIDDSGQNVRDVGEFLSYGSLWVNETEHNKLDSWTLELRKRYHCWGEISFKKRDEVYSTAYLEFLKLFEQIECKFRLIFFRKPSGESVKKYHGGDKIISKMKVIYNLLIQNYKNDNLKEKLYVVCDAHIIGKDTYRDQLVKYLNNTKPNSIEYIINSSDSHVSSGMQLSDMITGFLTITSTYYLLGSKATINKQDIPYYKELKKHDQIKPSRICWGLPDTKIRVWFYEPERKYLLSKSISKV